MDTTDDILDGHTHNPPDQQPGARSLPQTTVRTMTTTDHKPETTD